MLKKSHSLHTIALLFLILSSCGDKKSSDSVEPLAVSITYPIENSKIARDVPFRASIESLEGIESVQFFIDDSLIVSDTLTPYETNINTIDFEDGSYQLSVFARDAKERENADTITVNIFNDPKAPNSIKIDSISYSYANRKLQIYLPVTTTDFEYFMALIKLTLIFFSSFPPPTEKINNRSFLLSLLILSHSEKISENPSSFVLAVNSETLSVGA